LLDDGFLETLAELQKIMIACWKALDSFARKDKNHSNLLDKSYQACKPLAILDAVIQNLSGGTPCTHYDCPVM